MMADDTMQGVFALLFVAVCCGVMLSVAGAVAWLCEHADDLSERWLHFKLAIASWSQRRIERRIRRRLRKDVFRPRHSSFWGKA